MARPRVEIDWDDFDKLCGLQCTLDEIAAWFDCTKQTIRNAVRHAKGEGFLTYHAKKAQFGKASLRRAQYQSATGGNVTMQIWLGKQWLAQTDKIEASGKDGGPLNVIVEYVEHQAATSEAAPTTTGGKEHTGKV